MNAQATGRRKVRVGTVISNKMEKTIVVAVEWHRSHRLYKKLLRRVTTFKAHDEAKECRVGDVVRIVETRPLSKAKRWRVVEVLRRGEGPEVSPAQVASPLEQEVTEVPASAAPEPQAPAEKAPEAPQAMVEPAAPGETPAPKRPRRARTQKGKEQAAEGEGAAPAEPS